jgi:hypothetical protein
VGGGEHGGTTEEAFVWKSERAQVKLSQSGEDWLVEYSAVGRLLGPPQMLHVAKHRDPRLAAWDVMSRVQAAAKDDVIGMQAGLSAARWIKSRPRWNEPVDNGPGQPSLR